MKWIQRKGESVVSDIQENKSGYPILVYHKIDRKWEFGASIISPKKFLDQIRFLADHGYKSVNISETNFKKNIKDKYVCFMFDDAYECIYQYALPVLSEYGFTATIAIITDYIGKGNDWDIQFGRQFNHMSLDQIQTLSDYGWELASHTCSHYNLIFLNDATLRHELESSKLLIENISKRPVFHLVYPYGRANQRIYRFAKLAGYTGASGFHSIKGVDSSFCIKRHAVYAFDTNRTLINKINHTVFEKMKQRIVNFCSYGSWMLKYKNKKKTELDF